ncbi:MAG: hypothetical protein P8P30_04940 [Rickettsiales bacterium]|nr:hypothetical protein [Rickettsiales bacterium]
MIILVLGWLFYPYAFLKPITAFISLLPPAVLPFTNIISQCSFAAILIGLIYSTKKWSITPNLRKILIVYSLVIVCFNSFNLYDRYSFKHQEFSFNKLEETLKNHEPVTTPHIVYIVPDRYASNESLLDYYGFHNDTFTQSLRDKGFYVWDAQNANYTKTFQSIASTLNMTYLDSMIDTIGEDTPYHTPMYEVLEDHQVQRILKDIGYYFVHMGNWWDATRVNAHADLSVSPKSFITEFIAGYLSFTPFTSLQDSPLFKTDNPHACELIQRQRQAVIDRLKEPTPQFIYWHLFTSHPPYLYNSDGSCSEKTRWAKKSWDDKKQAYTEHIEHTNNLILGLHNQLINELPYPVIFVVQSDEGPYPQNYLLNWDQFNFWEASDTELKQKFGILNSIYFPSGHYPQFETEATPVNNFRLILSEIYGIDLPRLEHRSYSFEYNQSPYKLHDITDRLQSPTNNRQSTYGETPHAQSLPR